MTDGPSEPQLFHCPNCGAGLPEPDSPTVTCDYCGSQVLVPDEFIPPPPREEFAVSEPIVIRVDSQADTKQQAAASSLVKAVLIFVILSIVIGVGIAIFAGFGAFFTTQRVITSIDSQDFQVITAPAEIVIEELLQTVFSTITPTTTPGPFASLELQFGGEGNGAGMFDDPRQISTDVAGNIYISEYNTGRIQKFDPDGKFIKAWQLPPAEAGVNYIADLAADSSGQVYAVRGGDIFIFDESSQQPVQVIPGSFPDTHFSAVALDPANYIYTLANAMTGNDLLKLDQDGQVVMRVANIVNAVNKDTPPEDNVIAVDGLGNSYFLSVFEQQVYKYDALGQYNDRFGSEGDLPGQFSNPYMITLDGQGRIYVLDNSYINIFSDDGTFLNSIEWDYAQGSPREIAVGPGGDLYVLTSQGKVFEFKLNW